MISKEELESERTRITLLKAESYNDVLITQYTHALYYIDTALELYRQLEESEKKLSAVAIPVGPEPF